jgi:hypothetical protein
MYIFGVVNLIKETYLTMCEIGHSIKLDNKMITLVKMASGILVK